MKRLVFAVWLICSDALALSIVIIVGAAGIAWLLGWRPS